MKNGLVEASDSSKFGLNLCGPAPVNASFMEQWNRMRRTWRGL